MISNNTEHVPVTIIGGGPVGLAVALELGRRGIRSILIEQMETTNDFPRMLFVNYRSMQHCRRWGVADEVRSRTIYPVDYPLDIAFATGLNGKEITRFEYSCHKDAVLPNEVPEKSQICPQNIFDPLMVETVNATPNTDVRFSHKLESFEQDEDGISLQVTDLRNDKNLVIRTDFLVGCDGAASNVRKTLGIEMVGEFHDHNVSVLFRAPDILKNTQIKPARHVHIIGEGGFNGILNSVDGGTTWRMGFSGMAESVDPNNFDAVTRIREKIDLDVEMEIVASLPWTRATKSAEVYGQERVFLVGDAAHTWSPTGGFGMNTGLNDAVDIAWKLAATIDGWGGPELLKSYDLERRPACEGIINEARQNYFNLRVEADYKKIMEETPAGEVECNILAEKIQSTIRREYETIGVQMGYHYVDSPIIASEKDDGRNSRYDSYVPSSKPGHIAPHAWLGDNRSTMDLFDARYTLLSFGETDYEKLIASANNVGMPLAVKQIDDKEIARLYENKLVLVRPDGHVAWRGDNAPENSPEIIDRVRGVD